MNCGGGAITLMRNRGWDEECKVERQIITRRNLLRGLGGLTVAIGLAGCSQQHAEPKAAVEKPAPQPIDPLTSDELTTDVVDIDGSAKRGVWAKKMVIDDGFCTIKAGMAIIFNQDQSPNKDDSYAGTFDIWSSTVSDAKPHLHQGFEIFDAGGKSLFKLGPFDGLPMPSPVNYHHWIGYFDFPKSSYAQMAKCCRLPSTCKS
jgi:hypothetical protein